jgi:serine/threonine protein kinase
VLQQLLQGLAALQAQGISHRDVKPENLLVREAATTTTSSSSSAGGAGGCEQRVSSSHFHVRLIDFGSAVDAHSIASGLYGPLGQPGSSSSSSSGGGGANGSSSSSGPSVDELTLEYAAPEVVFSSRCAGGCIGVLHGHLTAYVLRSAPSWRQVLFTHSYYRLLINSCNNPVPVL